MDRVMQQGIEAAHKNVPPCTAQTHKQEAQKVSGAKSLNLSTVVKSPNEASI